MSRYSDQVRDEYGRIVPGVSIYVYKWDADADAAGDLETLTDDLSAPLANPLTSDADGLFYFNSVDGQKLIEYHFGGKVEFRDLILVGDLPVPQAVFGGLFVNASALSIPTGMDMIGTTGYATLGVGGANYIYDAAVDAAYVTAHPLTSFMSANSRGFRLDHEQDFVITMFGAKCDTSAAGVGGTDDTTAVQAAIDYLAALGGGTILIPAHTKCASSLNLDSLHNIRLIGPSGQGANSAPPPAQLIYTGTGSGRFISGQHSTGISIRELGVRYTSASFTGDLIAFTNTTGGADAAYALVERCLVGGIGVNTARSCISLEGAILCAVVDNHINWAQVGVRGQKEIAVANVLYSNAHKFTRNTFDNLAVSGLLNPGQGWSVESNWFEGTNGGSGGMPRALWSDISLASGANTSGLTWRDNWCGDAVNVTDAWFSLNHQSARGLTVSGGYWDTGGTSVACIKLPVACEGVDVTGGTFSSTIDFGSAGHIGVNVAGAFLGADLLNVASIISFHAWGNRLNGGFAKEYRRFANMIEDGAGPQGGGTVTQLTSRATAVTVNKLHGQISLFNAAGSATWASFQVNNSLVKAIDMVDVCQQANGSVDTYHCLARPFAGGLTVFFQTTGGTTTETIVLNFRVHSGSFV